MPARAFSPGSALVPGELRLHFGNLPWSFAPFFHCFASEELRPVQVIFMFYVLLFIAECVVLMIAYAIWQAPDRR